MKIDEGKKIYQKNKRRFDNKGRNTDDWIENIRGNHLRKIVSHFGGKKIPYSCFSSSKKLCKKLFKSDNDWNYIYYTVYMGVRLGYLSEGADGLKYSD
jgi:hypothetical protein